ncbi:hypothetical protein GFY24_00700 [Nocardia sp. SYP-A9097]|uniref:hypothetical protein n=1 Tax=Nocardia sp. SYP-A9097 TaxID=2663237 RepID=UPI00129C0994|nr:hypothetical protein [Nocardia sp. SYP-A9097]MRH85996.1 hypothetical protein [Nocardia sp. SYP-A9097]
MTQVTVRAEQRFGDWALGEVRTIARTRLVETLISDGRVSVAAEYADPVPAPPAADPDPASIDADTADRDEAEPPAPPEPARRRRPDRA